MAVVFLATAPRRTRGEGGVRQQNGRGRRTLTAVAQDAHGPVVCGFVLARDSATGRKQIDDALK